MALKGLELARMGLQIDVVDKDPVALASGNEFISNMILPELAATVTVWNSLQECLHQEHPFFDLVIVSTSAPGRMSVVKELVANDSVKHFLIEKPIETNVSNIKSMMKLLAGKSAFVNHPRRLMAWQKQIKKIIEKFDGIKCIIEHKDLALACNGSHFIDLVHWWTGQLPVSVNINENNSNWQPSKRDGFWDFYGEVSIEFDNGASLIFFPPNNNKSNIIRVDSRNRESVVIDEVSGSARFSSGNVIFGKNVPQSELSGLVLMNLIKTGECGLPEFEIAASCNLLFTDALHSSWKKHWRETHHLFCILHEFEAFPI